MYYFVVGGVVGTFTGNPQGVTHMFLLLILLTLLAIGERLNNMKYIKNLIVVFLAVVVGVILSLFTKENLYVYLTYFMVIYNTVITLSMVYDLEELKEQIESKDTK